MNTPAQDQQRELYGFTTSQLLKRINDAEHTSTLLLDVDALLGEALEAIALGRPRLARQRVNCAKYFINEVKLRVRSSEFRK